MKTIRELKAKRAAKKAAEENPLSVWESALAEARNRAKARCAKEARERDLRIEATHAFLRVL